MERKEEEVLSTEFILTAWMRYLEYLLVRRKENIWMGAEPRGPVDLCEYRSFGQIGKGSRV